MGELNATLVKQISDAILLLNNNVIALDASYTKMLNDLAKGNATLKTKETNTKTLTDAEKALKVEADNLARAEKEAAKTANILEKERQKLVTVAQKAAQKEAELQAALIKEVKSEQDLINQTNALVAVRKRLDTTTDSGKKKHAELTTKIAENTKALKSSDEQIGRNQRNVGNYGTAFGGLGGAIGQVSPALGRATSASQTFGKSLLKLLANPIVAIVAGIVAVFAGLVAVFKSTDDGGTKIAAIMAALGSVLDVLKRRAVVLTEAFAALFSGKFREAGKLFKDAMSDIGEEIRKTTQAAYDYTMALDAIKDRNIAMISEIAKTKNAIEKLVSLSKDQTKSDQERLNALEKALKLEKQLADDKVKLLEEGYKNELQNQAAKANIDKNTLDAFIQMGEKEQTAARANNKALADAWNVLGDDNIKTLEEMYAAAIDADTEYFKSTQRMVAQLSGFRKSLANEEKKAVITDSRIKIEAIRENVIEEIDIEKGKTEILLGLKQHLADKDAEVAERKKELDKKDLQAAQDLADKKAMITDIAFQAAFGASDLLFEKSAQNRDAEIAAIEEKNKKGLISDEQAAKQIAAIKTKQAKADKSEAIFNIVLNTAQAILKATAQTGILAPFVIPGIIAMGAIQAALVAARPIPKFKKGTKGKHDTPGAFITSEKGAGVEAIEKGGKVTITDKPTLFTGMKGARVYSNPELNKMAGYSPKNQLELNQLIQTVSSTGKDTVHAIKGIKTFIVDENRQVYGFKRDNYRRNYL